MGQASLELTNPMPDLIKIILIQDIMYRLHLLHPLRSRLCLHRFDCPTHQIPGFRHWTRLELVLVDADCLSGDDSPNLAWKSQRFLVNPV